MSRTTEILSKEEIIALISKEKSYLSEKYFVSEIGLFGSYTRGEQHKKSDIDLLIDFKKIPDLFTYIEIIQYLTKKFKRKVDLVTKDALREEIKAQILKEVINI